MKSTLWMAAAILLGTSLILAGCKGKEGPAGAAGTSYIPPAPLCSSPTTLGLATTPIQANFDAGVLRCSPITLATAATAIRLSSHISGATVTGQMRMGIYSDITDYPGNLIVETGPANLTPASWNTVNLPYNVYLPAGKYWLCCILSNTNNMSYQSGAGAGNQIFINYPWAALPQTYPAAATSGSNRYCITAAVCP